MSHKTVAQRLNNPGCLRFAQQPGASMGEKNFAYFENPEDGWKALVRQIEKDADEGFTLWDFMFKYAPESENDTKKYVANISDWGGWGYDQYLDEIDPYFLAICIARKEGYFA